MNKRYQILKRLGDNWSPSFENETDSLEDATQMCSLLQKMEDARNPEGKIHWVFYVVQVLP